MTVNVGNSLTPGYEVGDVYAWLYEALSDSSVFAAGASGVFADVAEAGTPPPFVVFSLYAPASDSAGASAIRLLVDGQYFVRVHAQRSQFATAAAIMKAVDARLERSSGHSGNTTIALCTREHAVMLREGTPTETWVMPGGIYRIIAFGG